jgi:cytochrome c5
MKIFPAVLLVCASAWAADQLPDGPGKATLIKVCTDCHGAEVVTGMSHDRQGWKEIVDQMLEKGATADEKQIKEIIDYLAKAFPKKSR